MTYFHNKRIKYELVAANQGIKQKLTIKNSKINVFIPLQLLSEILIICFDKKK